MYPGSRQMGRVAREVSGLPGYVDRRKGNGDVRT